MIFKRMGLSLKYTDSIYIYLYSDTYTMLLGDIKK